MRRNKEIEIQKNNYWKSGNSSTDTWLFIISRLYHRSFKSIKTTIC